MSKTIVDNFHAKSKEETLRVLGVDEKLGLTKEEVIRRKERFGANVLPQEKRISRIVLFLRQFKSPLIFILAIAGAVTFIIGEYTDGFVIWAAVLLNTFIDYFQEEINLLINIGEMIKYINYLKHQLQIFKNHQTLN